MNKIKYEIKSDDLRIDVNLVPVTTSCGFGFPAAAIRITHVPTGTVVQCASERSQHRNRAIALDMLEEKLSEEGWDAVLIGLSGRAGSGKDTTANLLVGDFLARGMQVKTLAFAGKLKEVICDVFGLDSVVFDDRVLKNAPMLALGGRSPREAAQFIGTSAFREIRSSVWVDYAMKRAQGYLSQGISVIVTDVRFVNEAEAIAAHGGYVVSIERDSAEVYDHPSETAIDEIKKYSDWVLDNNGTMDDLRRKVEAFTDKFTDKL